MSPCGPHSTASHSLCSKLNWLSYLQIRPVGQTFSFCLSWSSLPSKVLQRHSVGVQKRCVGLNGTDLEPFCTASPPCWAGNCCQHEVLLGEEGEKAKSGERMDGGLQREGKRLLGNLFIEPMNDGEVETLKSQRRAREYLVHESITGPFSSAGQSMYPSESLLIP